MEMFFAIILMAVVVEGIVTYVKEWFVNKTVAWQQIFAIVLGVLVTVGYNADLFALFGLTASIPYLGCVLTGVLIARGSNYIFDLIKKVQGYKTETTE